MLHDTVPSAKPIGMHCNTQWQWKWHCNNTLTVIDSQICLLHKTPSLAVHMTGRQVTSYLHYLIDVTAYAASSLDNYCQSYTLHPYWWSETMRRQTNCNQVTNTQQYVHRQTSVTKTHLFLTHCPTINNMCNFDVCMFLYSVFLFESVYTVCCDTRLWLQKYLTNVIFTW